MNITPAKFRGGEIVNCFYGSATVVSMFFSMSGEWRYDVIPDDPSIQRLGNIPESELQKAK